MNIDDSVWYPCTFPLPNMMVQAGREVVIKDLTSNAGQSINGKKGKALAFHPELNGRWSIELEDGTHKSIRIQNLEYHGALRMGFTGECLDLVTAGTMAGEPALMIFYNPKRPGFNLELIKEKFLLMGVPLGLLDSIPFRRRQMVAVAGDRE
jgi:hypothetical protein